MTRRLTTGEADFERRLDQLVAARRGAAPDVREVVQTILADVRERGDEAVSELTRRFDRMPSDVGLRVKPADVEAACAATTPADRDALAFAAERIRAFHELQRPEAIQTTDALGVRQELRWRPVDSVGLYVPGGMAAYPSSVLMNAIPAQVAGCGRVVMAVPAPDGILNPLVLTAAATLGIDEIWRIGGAQAIGALAYGTAAIAPVDKIVGPGNAYVAEAKRQVFGEVGIDMIAGPSEVVVVADAGADPAWVAADLLSQSEHGEDAQAILITDDAALADAVAAAVAAQLETLPRRQIAEASWRQHGAIIVAGLDATPRIVDRLAPEHLELLVEAPQPLLDAIRHAGSVFVGPFTPEVIGDYVGGPNHVLPTARSARFASGLGVLDFMKRTTVLGCDARALGTLGPPAARLARAEGLDGHARAVDLRLEALGEH